MDKQNKNHYKYGYFLKQCNLSPISKEWREIFGEITQKTIQEFGFKVNNPNDYNEAIAFTKILKDSLTKPLCLYDQTYKIFCAQELVPAFIRKVIGEILNDHGFNILLLKKRRVLGIPIKTGLEPPDPAIYGEHVLSTLEKQSILHLSIYTGLKGNTWQRFFIYLLLHNYVMPIKNLEIDEIYDLLGNKAFARLMEIINTKIKPKSLKKRQMDFVIAFLSVSDQITYEALQDRIAKLEIEEAERIIRRKSYADIRSFFEKIFSTTTIVNRFLTSIQKRQARYNEYSTKQLKEIQDHISKLQPRKIPS